LHAGGKEIGMLEHEIVFDEMGNAGALYSDDLLPYFREVLGLQFETRRASHVEPNGWGQWYVRVASWVPGGARTFGPFATRAMALEVEIDYLKAVL
jgi:hypothetical protein